MATTSARSSRPCTRTTWHGAMTARRSTYVRGAARIACGWAVRASDRRRGRRRWSRLRNDMAREKGALKREVAAPVRLLADRAGLPELREPGLARWIEWRRVAFDPRDLQPAARRAGRAARDLHARLFAIELRQRAAARSDERRHASGGELSGDGNKPDRLRARPRLVGHGRVCRPRGSGRGRS